MPYTKIADLPQSVRDHLPKQAQEIYKEAFNHAFEQSKDHEARAHKIAWGAVKKKYAKGDDGEWHKKS